MMYTSEYLTLCHRLLGKHNFRLTPGLRIGRRFADVGFEEFSVITQQSIVSLMSGKIIPLEADFLTYYFPIYSVEELLRLLYSSHIDVESITYVEQRTWSAILKSSNSDTVTLSCSTVEELFLRGLLWALKI